MELDAPRTGVALYQKPNQGNIGRSVKVGDLVRLTTSGVIAAWYPNLNEKAVGIVVKAIPWGELDDEARSSIPVDLDGTTWVLVEWPNGRDYHTTQDLYIVNKDF
tara:strand:+ start:153 stop:467 length:315 start_codon:yes stop_codon:yes gene_type:complete